MRSVQAKAEFSKQFDTIVKGVEVSLLDERIEMFRELSIILPGICETTRKYVRPKATETRTIEASISTGAMISCLLSLLELTKCD
jgi:hypothetical protein